MRKYTAKECTCWCDYPNPYYSKKKRTNKCLEQYRNISLTNNVTRKTKCVLIESESEEEKE